ncbi:MAG: hypothetical protein ACI9WU_003269 [Myxococcota bacterium]|jgi:hypothetical protein
MRSVLCALLIAGLPACSGDSASDGNRRGGAGSSCLTTDDCKAPLECINNVCVGPDGADAVSDAATGGDVAVADDVATPMDVESLPDLGPTPDLGPPPTADAVFEIFADLLEDVPPLPDDPGPQPELPSDVLNPVGDCEELGIASDWEGQFTGEIDYDLGAAIPGLIEKDILPVAGDLSFSIQCIEKKLVVLGELDGLALAQYPFTLTLQGSYSPTTETLTAKMVDGQVFILGIVEVYFAGDFTGQLVGTAGMAGDWDGESTGNNVGLNAVALGVGQWTAEPASP